MLHNLQINYSETYTALFPRKSSLLQHVEPRWVVGEAKIVRLPHTQSRVCACFWAKPHFLRTQASARWLPEATNTAVRFDVRRDWKMLGVTFWLCCKCFWANFFSAADSDTWGVPGEPHITPHLYPDRKSCTMNHQWKALYFWIRCSFLLWDALCPSRSASYWSFLIKVGKNFLWNRSFFQLS